MRLLICLVTLRSVSCVMVIIGRESCEGQAQDGGVGVISAAKLVFVHICLGELMIIRRE